MTGVPNRNSLLLLFIAEYVFWHLLLFTSLFLAGSPGKDTLIYTHPAAFQYTSGLILLIVVAIMTGHRWWKWNKQQSSTWAQIAKITAWVVIVLHPAAWVVQIILLAVSFGLAKYSLWEIISYVILLGPRQLTEIIPEFGAVSVIWIFCLTLLIEFLSVFLGLFAGQKIMAIYHQNK